MIAPSILIIEDHKDFREAIQHFLELHHLGVHIIQASSGEEGVFLAIRKKPDIVVMDFSLGGINGLEAAGKIKKQLPKCSIIMLTIYDSKEIVHRDKQGAIRFFINKSDLYERLVPVINKILCVFDINKRKYIKVNSFQSIKAE